MICPTCRDIGYILVRVPNICVTVGDRDNFSMHSEPCPDCTMGANLRDLEEALKKARTP